MKKIKIVALVVLLIFGLVFISNLDKNLRYKIDLMDYNRYNAPLSDDEISFIENKNLLVGVYNYPPLAYTNSFNNYNTGIMVDYLSQLAIELTSNIHTKVGKNEDLIQSLDRDDIDIILSENRKGEKGRDDILLTQPLCTVKSKILVKKNSNIRTIEDLEGKTLVTLQKDNLDFRISGYFKDVEDLDIIEVENIYQGFALLDKNFVAGFVGDDMAAAHFLQVTSKGGIYKFLEPVIYEKEISLGVKEENMHLLNILNKGILQLKKKNLITQTQHKWLGSFQTDSLDIKSIEIAYRFIILATIIFGAFSVWNYSIVKKVNEKTRELSESRSELCLIIETMENGILVIENDSEIVECNDAISRITGISKRNLMRSEYRDIRELNPFLDKKNWNRILNLGDSYYYITSQDVTDNKKMIVVEDYTEKYLKEKVERQESKMIAIGQLSAGLAHEIRNPLGLIKSYTYIIENDNPSEKYKQALSVINNSIKRINNLIENLLRFSRFANEETQLVNVKEFIDSIIEVEKDSIEEDINIRANYKEMDREEISINTEVLRMVLINLINNSVDSFYGVEKTDKKIEINVYVKENQFNLSIIDNGCGIEEEKLDKIFNPFFSTKESGTGLGLYIISTEVTNHNGRITVSSELGEGTTFNIVLPIME